MPLIDLGENFGVQNAEKDQTDEEKKQIREISQARRVAEVALAIEYKVSECNQKRSEIQANSDAQIKTLQLEIFELENNLGQ